MPYITDYNRRKLDNGIGKLAYELHDMGRDPGNLNYAITSLLLYFLGANPRYADFNEALGVIEAAKLELYRRRVAPYEDAKAEVNGEVY